MRNVSIIGDSISTFKGYNPPGYAVYYDEERQQINGLSSVYDTWWAKVNQAMGAHLCVNNSFSGSRVTGNGYGMTPSWPAASCLERLSNLHTPARNPDIILIYIGFNDFGNRQQIYIGNKTGSYRNSTDTTVFGVAYDYMLWRIRQNYPEAKVICGTLMRSRIKDHASWSFPEKNVDVLFEDYNNAIRMVCRGNNCFLADLSTLGVRYETLDGSHPTFVGHLEIASAWIVRLHQLFSRQ